MPLPRWNFNNTVKGKIKTFHVGIKYNTTVIIILILFAQLIYVVNMVVGEILRSYHLPQKSLLKLLTTKNRFLWNYLPNYLKSLLPRSERKSLPIQVSR